MSRGKLALVGLALLLTGYVAGAASLYLAGPMLGARLQRTGAHLVGLGGNVAFLSQEEAARYVEAKAGEAVAVQAQKFLPPSIVRR